MARHLTSSARPAKSGKATSLVIFLHGYGADGADLLGLADPLSEHLPDTAFVAPNAPESCTGNPFGFQWFPIPWIDGSTEADAEAGLIEAAEDLNAFLDTQAVAYGLTPDRIAVIGFSQGSMMAFQVLPRRAAPIAGLVAFSGRLLDPDRLAAEAVSKLPVLLIHGDIDEVVPFDDMSRAGQALTKAGFETFGHVMKDTGHGIAPDGLGVALAFLKERLGVT